MNRWRGLQFLMFSTLLSGCQHLVVALPQVTAVKAFLTAPRGNVDLTPLAWTLTWGGETAPVVPVVLEDRFIFSNRGGVAIHFNGWQITQVDGLFPRGPLRRTVAQNGEYRVTLGDRVVLEGRCEPWGRASFPDGSFEWQQRCDGAENLNRLRVDPAGNMVSINMAVHPAYAALRLERGAAAAP